MGQNVFKSVCVQSKSHFAKVQILGCLSYMAILRSQKHGHFWKTLSGSYLKTYPFARQPSMETNLKALWKNSP